MRVRWVAGFLATVVTATALSACSTTIDGHSAATPPSYLALSRIVLQQSDFPSNWKPRPAVNTADDPDVQAEVAGCAGVRIRSAQRLHRATSPDYGTGDFTASSTASSFKTEIEVQNRLSALLGSNADACLTKVLRTSLAKVIPGDTKIENLSVQVAKGGVEENVVATAHAVITVTALGQTARVYSDTAFIGGTLFGVEVAFTGIGAPVPSDVQRRLTAAVAGRAARV
jgi:hypothetical protein